MKRERKKEGRKKEIPAGFTREFRKKQKEKKRKYPPAKRAWSKLVTTGAMANRMRKKKERESYKESKKKKERA